MDTLKKIFGAFLAISGIFLLYILGTLIPATIAEVKLSFKGSSDFTVPVGFLLGNFAGGIVIFVVAVLLLGFSLKLTFRQDSIVGLLYVVRMSLRSVFSVLILALVVVISLVFVITIPEFVSCLKGLTSSNVQVLFKYILFFIVAFAAFPLLFWLRRRLFPETKKS